MPQQQQKYDAIRHTLILRNKTATITKVGNKFAHPGGRQGVCALLSRPCRKVLYCDGLPVWGCLMMGRFRRKLDLGTISKPENISLLGFHSQTEVSTLWLRPSQLQLRVREEGVPPVLLSLCPPCVTLTLRKSNRTFLP